MLHDVMLQNIAAQNVKYSKHKRHITYRVIKRIKCKVHITLALQNVCMFCDAVRYVKFTF